MNIEPKLRALEQDFMEIERRMSDPAVASDPRELQTLGKRRAQLEPVVEKYREYRATLAGIEEARELLKAGDPEMEALARDELDALEPKIEGFTAELKLLLLPRAKRQKLSL